MFSLASLTCIVLDWDPTFVRHRRLFTSQPKEPQKCRSVCSCSHPSPSVIKDLSAPFQPIKFKKGVVNSLLGGGNCGSSAISKRPSPIRCLLPSKSVHPSSTPPRRTSTVHYLYNLRISYLAEVTRGSIGLRKAKQGLQENAGLLRRVVLGCDRCCLERRRYPQQRKRETFDQLVERLPPVRCQLLQSPSLRYLIDEQGAFPKERKCCNRPLPSTTSHRS